MSFGDRAILWLHVTAAIFTIGPGTAAIMSTPRFIRARNPAVVGYLLRTTRIYSIGALLVLVFGLILTGMTHKFSQWWIYVSLTLFVVAVVLLVIILRDQKKALDALSAAEGTVGSGPVEVTIRSSDDDRSAAETDPAGTDPAGTGRPPSAAPPVEPAPSAMSDIKVAAVERGRIVAMGGVTALIWLVILVLMVWH
jgi:Ca2+/Na+ antiporter